MNKTIYGKLGVALVVLIMLAAATRYGYHLGEASAYQGANISNITTVTEDDITETERPMWERVGLEIAIADALRGIDGIEDAEVLLTTNYDFEQAALLSQHYAGSNKKPDEQLPFLPDQSITNNADDVVGAILWLTANRSFNYSEKGAVLDLLMQLTDGIDTLDADKINIVYEVNGVVEPYM